MANTTNTTSVTRSARRNGLLVDDINVITGTDGHDVIIGTDGDDAIYGLFGNDILNGGGGNDVIEGGQGYDQLRGDAGDDALIGGQGNDILDGGTGNDTMYGEDDNDTFIGGLGNDVMDGGAGNDEVMYVNSASAVNISLITGTGVGGDAQGDTLTSIEFLTGSNYNDTLQGNEVTNRLTGGSGHDRLFGNGGDDLLYGGTGNDTLDGGLGNDFMEAGIGDDSLYGASGADMLNGGTGFDTAVYGGTSGVTVNLATGKGHGGEAEGDTLIGIESVIGTSYDDIITSGTGYNVLKGMNGNDTFYAAQGTQVDGGDGFDTVIYSQATAGVSLSMSNYGVLNGVEKVVGTSFGDYITGTSGADQLSGGAGNDTLNGYTGPGADGSDILNGDAGNDILQGWAGNDILNGGNDHDSLKGGIGNDTLRGGDGSDTIYIARGDGIDTVVQDVTDGAASHDMINFEDGISYNQLWFRQDGNNLVVDVIGETSSSVILADWYSGNPDNRIDEFLTLESGGGHSLSHGNVQMLVDAMAAFNPPAVGELNLSPELLEALQPTLAAAWA